jgi:putative ABC transport system permease protein
MIRNYLSIALRNIRQNPLFSLINIFSLAIGLSACLVIYLFITDELSFDSFHTKKESIYRLDETQNFSGTNVQKVALSMQGMGPHLVIDYPEIESYARFYNRGKQLISLGETQFLIENVAIADSTFLEMFDFELLAGDRQTALDEPWTIILTEETALKFFKDPLAALGGSLRFADKDYKITGVAANVPENSHLKFDAITSMATFIAQDKDFNNKWGGNWVNTYLTLKPNTDLKALEAKFPAFMSRHNNDPDINKYYTLFLQKLDQVHLGSTDVEHDYNNYRKFNGSYLDIFTIVGAFILLIASVNFMNLTTARASHRWKEIGVRSSIGAKKSQLFVQFIFESVLLAIFSLLLAVVLDILLIPALNQLIGRQLSLLTLLAEPMKILGLFIITIALGLLAGIYPSFYMTSFRMTTILKGGGKSERRSIFRSSLVVVQFGLALAMIVSTLIVLEQLSFMQHKDLGFNKDQMMLLDMNKEVNGKFTTLKEELLKSRFVHGVTASGQRLGNNFHQWGFKVKGDTGVVDITPSNVNVDYDYIRVYGIKVKEGRDFSKDNNNYA